MPSRVVVSQARMGASITRGLILWEDEVSQSQFSPLFSCSRVNGNSIGQYQHPEPHADSQGVVGRDETIAGAKIDPLAGKNKQAETELPGLDDENVDSSRIPPMGEVREEMS